VLGLLEHISGLWRIITTPKIVRDVEDDDPQRAVENLPKPTPSDPKQDQHIRQMRERLSAIEQRNREIEARMRDMGRLYDRRRGG
jgi:hypothetical protein